MARRRGKSDEALVKGVGGLVLLAVLAGGGIKGVDGVLVVAISALLTGAIAVGGYMLVTRLLRPTNGAPTQNTRLDVATSVTPSGVLSRFELGAALDALDWFQLEKLVAALFESKGNSVTPRGGANADGGIDLVVESESSKAAVQCKHWAKWKCGPAVVRELLGSMTHESFSRGFLICRTPTDAARSLAETENITIVDREGLIDRIESALETPGSKVFDLLTNPPKLCPKCGAAMVLRKVAKGQNAGAEFWGCSTYPKCNQTMRV
jgi:hypothetical protein